MGEGEGGEDVGGTVGMLWGSGGGAQNEDWFFPENSVNFFEKPTFHFKIKTKWENYGNFFEKFGKFQKFSENSGNSGNLLKYAGNLEKN